MPVRVHAPLDLLTAFHQGVLVVDRSWRVVFANAAAATLVGGSVDELIGALLWEAAPALHGSGVEVPLRRSMEAEDGSGERFEARVDALARWLGVQTSWLGHGHERVLVLVVDDVTERRRREANAAFLAGLDGDLAELTGADAILERMARSIGTFLDVRVCALCDVDESSDTVVVAHAWHADAGTLLGDGGAPPPSLSRLCASAAVRASRDRGETVIVADGADRDGADRDAADAGRSSPVPEQLPRALVSVPFVRARGGASALIVADDRPRAWRRDEVELLEATAARVFPRIERARADAALRASEERYRVLTESLPHITFTTAPDGSDLVVNKRWFEYTGIVTWDDEPAARGLIDAAVHPDERERVAATWARAIEEESAFELQCRIYAAMLGRYRWYLVRVAPVPSPSGGVLHWIGTATDIDEQKRYEEEVLTHRSELLHRAHHDLLTGLPNRLLFEDRLQQAVAAATRFDRVLAVLFVDLDGFKLVNDTFGHATGDRVLEEVADRLRGSLRDTDTLARLHGDEFGVVLSELSDEGDAEALSRALLATIARPYWAEGRSVAMSASIGVGLFPRDGTDPRSLLRAADLAMYTAKLSGKNDVRFYAPSMGVPAFERRALAAHLEGALERGEMRLHYQPQWDTRTGSIASLEALLRWTSPDLGSVSPERFVPISEERGAFGRIVSWSLDHACGCARDLSAEAGMPLRVALNVAPERLLRTAFAEQVEQAIERHGLLPHQLELELVMSQAIENTSALASAVGRTRALGVRVTLDRFGTDAGSLSPLLDLPLDGVKFDMAVVRRAEHDPRLRQGLAAMVALVHDVGLDAVAVGIETPVQRDVMSELGCERLQGFLFGRPAPRAEAAALLREQSAAALF